VFAITTPVKIPCTHGLLGNNVGTSDISPASTATAAGTRIGRHRRTDGVGTTARTSAVSLTPATLVSMLTYALGLLPGSHRDPAPSA